MKKFLFQLLIAFTTFASLTACGPSRPSSNSLANSADTLAAGIIGGMDVPQGHVLTKSLVAILLPNGNFGPGGRPTGALCTGILLANNIVLTAAHCVESDASKLILFFGSSVQNGTPFLRPDGVSVSTLWPSRKNLPSDQPDQGDIALLHFRGNPPLRFVPLPILPANIETLIKPGASLVVAGYGLNQTNGVIESGAGQLRMASARLTTPRFGQTEILVDQTQGHGACHGDSGGPMLMISPTNQVFVWGLISRGIKDPKDQCSQWAAGTNVTLYSAWIESETARLVRQSGGGRTNPFAGF